MEATAWIFDYVSSLLRSPSWEASVFDFIVSLLINQIFPILTFWLTNNFTNTTQQTGYSLHHF